jgi:hypothetical protein
LRSNVAVADYLLSHELRVHSEPAYHGLIRWRRSADKASRGRNNAAELRALCIEDGGQCFFLPKIKQLAISEYAAYLAILYGICDLARYHPDYWMELQHNRTPEYFLIREFLDVAEEKVPNLVLNHLSRRTWVFKTS